MSTTANPQPHIARQHGISLVEIMVALTIGLVLMAGVIQIFLSSKQSYRMQNSLSRLQENGRFAIDFLSRDTRAVDYNGCFSGSLGSAENILNDPSNYGWDINNTLQGHEANAGTWTPALPAVLNGNVITGTDVIAVRYVSTDGISLVAPFSASAQLFIDPADNNFSDGEVLMATDCTQTSIFQTTNIQAAGGKINVVHSASGAFTPGNSTPQLANSYGADAMLARFETNTYFIGTGAGGGPALFRANLVATGGDTAQLDSQELIEGVENMQILYGEDTNNDNSANRYLDAAAVGNMANVVSVRIALLVRAEEQVKGSIDSSSTYNLLGTVAGPFNDRRLRNVFTTSIAIRNRIF